MSYLEEMLAEAEKIQRIIEEYMKKYPDDPSLSICYDGMAEHIEDLKKQIEHERVREPWEKYVHPYDEIYYGTEKAVERAKERMAKEESK